jgi:urease beta subunit
MPGVRELIDDVRLEVLMDDGPRLVVVVDPLGGGGLAPDPDGPGAVRPTDTERSEPPERETREIAVRSESRRAIRVSSHYPFHLVNARLVFDREVARGFRLDAPAGVSEHWSPGETRTVRLVRFGGTAGAGSEGADAGGAGGPEAGGAEGAPS